MDEDTLVERMLRRTPLFVPARWLWHQRPSWRAQMRHQVWLSQRSKDDDERMSVVLAAVLRADSNVVDIGAAAGSFLADVIRIAPHGQHIAYEPLTHFAEQLRADFPHVQVRPVAVGDSNEDTTFVHATNSPAWSGLREYGMEIVGGAITETVPTRVVRLDEDLPAGYVPQVIKIDVNGAEALVLRGAAKTLERGKPLVFIEHGTAAAAYGTSPADVHSLFANVGYGIFTLSGVGPLSVPELERELNGHWNFMARHC